MKKVSINKYRVVMGILGAVMLLALGLVWFLFTDIKNNSKNLVSVKDAANALEMQNAELQNFKKVYGQYQPSLQKMRALFIDADNPVDFIKFLENTANDANVNSEIALQSDTDPKAAMMIFQLSTSGDFVNLLHFLEALENGPYLVSIENANIKDSAPEIDTQDKNTGKVDATFLVKSFTNPKPQTTP